MFFIRQSFKALVVGLILLVAQPAFAALKAQDEGSDLGYVYIVNCVGSNLECTKSGGKMTITESGAGGSGDNVTVNSTAIDTTANLLDNIYMDFDVADGGAGGPDDVTTKFEYAQTLAGNPAFLVGEFGMYTDGASAYGFIAEGSTADTNEFLILFPLGNPADTTNYFALGASDGDALAGDSATGFFDAGTIDDARVDGSLEEDEINHDNLTGFVGNEHIDHTGVTLTAGAGLSGGGDISANRSFATASGEADFLASGALTCGASTQGKAQVHTTPLQYCDNAATPALQYAAYGASDGDALAGDSASSFFDAGAIEAARGGTGGDSSASTGVARVDSGSWSYSELSGDVSTSGSNATTIGNDKILEAMLKAVDAAADEECLTYETTTGDFEWQTCGSGSDTNSVKEYWWPGSALLPLEHAADSVPPISKDAGTNVDGLPVLFDSDTDECRTASFKVPSDVASGSTITMRYVWYADTTGNVMWDFRHTSGDTEGESWDSSLTTVAADADAAQSTADQITVTTDIETLANLGWAANDLVAAEICRNADHASDTVGGDASLVGFGVEIPRA